MAHHQSCAAACWAAEISPTALTKLTLISTGITAVVVMAATVPVVMESAVTVAVAMTILSFKSGAGLVLTELRC